eukprot:g57603.t1
MIGDAGAIAIANALQVNKTVINIVLASNRIGHDGAKVIGAALQVNNMLTSLELSSNNIGNAGEQTLERLASQHHLAGIVWTKMSSEQDTKTYPHISDILLLLHWTMQVLESKLSFLCLVSGARSATVTCSNIYMEASDGPREGQVTRRVGRGVGVTDFPKIIYIDIYIVPMPQADARQLAVEKRAGDSGQKRSGIPGSVLKKFEMVSPDRPESQGWSEIHQSLRVVATQSGAYIL